MKKVLGVSLVLNGVLAAGLLWKAGAAHAVGCPVGNGDVNGDGKIEITDVIYLLKSLFAHGPAPVSFCTPPPKGLPATGQTKCYDNAGNVIDCASASCPGQDGSYATDCPSDGRFTDNGDGTVTDNCTGLMWQKDTADVNGDGQIDGNLVGTDTLSWCDALVYCENLSFAGRSDWRLPNVRELQSIADYGRSNPSIDPIFGAIAEAYWSSTTVDLFPNDAWPVGFKVGDIDWDLAKTIGSFVRAVRNAR
jgi:hypothetical protein